jgi:hypothetical protein
LKHRATLRELKELTVRHSLSIAAGDLQLLDGRLYVTHSGLLRIATRKRCRSIETALQESLSSRAACSNGHGTAQPRLRDKLCVLIRRFKLDPCQVKSYAADFCGTQAVSEASRESLEAFVSHLNRAAEENRDALVCKLSSYAPRAEVGQ